MNIEQILLIIVLMYILFNGYNITERMENKEDKRNENKDNENEDKGNENKNKKNEDSNNWLLWLIVAGVIILILLGIFFYFRSNPNISDTHSATTNLDYPQMGIGPEVYETVSGYPTRQRMKADKLFDCSNNCTGADNWNECYRRCLDNN